MCWGEKMKKRYACSLAARLAVVSFAASGAEAGNAAPKGPTVGGEVNNGGFDQYYFNTAGKFASDAVAAFELRIARIRQKPDEFAGE